MSAGAESSGALPRFTIVSRVDCHLCDVMKAELGAFLSELTGVAADAALGCVTVLDVDASDELRRRYGHKVPVLLADGEVVCHGQFDRAEAQRLTRTRARRS